MKRRVSTFLIVAILFSFALPSMAITTDYTVASGLKEIKVDRYISDKGDSLFPLREIGQLLGVNISWDRNKNLISLTRTGYNASLKNDEKNIRVNGKDKELDFKPVIKNGRTYVGLDLFSKGLGFNIEENHQARRIEIDEYKKEKFFKQSEDIEITKKLDEYMLELKNTHNFHGNVLVAKDDAILLNKGYGFADIDKKIPIKPEDKVSVGSVTKQFTAMGIMQLEEKGIISLDDSLDKYIKDFKNGGKITIHNLLTHSSGIKNFTDMKEIFKLDIKNPSPMKIIDLVKDRDLEFEPGEKFSYSNTNYVILTRIIEEASGQSYEEYMAENIFKPLNMKDTGVHYGERHIKLKVRPYMGHLYAKEIGEEIVLAWVFGAGNMYSTTEDLYRWDRALKTDKLVKKETMDKIFTGYIDISKDRKAGYGWEISENEDGKNIGHGGNTLGFTSRIDRYVDKDLTIIIVSNIGQYDLNPISRALKSIVLGQDYKLPEKLEEVEIKDKSIYDRYAGRYLIEGGLYVNLVNRNGSLIARIPILGPVELRPLSATKFYSRDIPIGVEFNLKDGHVDSISISPFGLEGKKQD